MSDAWWNAFEQVLKRWPKPKWTVGDAIDFNARLSDRARGYCPSIPTGGNTMNDNPKEAILAELNKMRARFDEIEASLVEEKPAPLYDQIWTWKGDPNEGYTIFNHTAPESTIIATVYTEGMRRLMLDIPRFVKEVHDHLENDIPSHTGLRNDIQTLIRGQKL